MAIPTLSWLLFCEKRPQGCYHTVPMQGSQRAVESLKVTWSRAGGPPRGQSLYEAGLIPNASFPPIDLHFLVNGYLRSF